MPLSVQDQKKLIEAQVTIAESMKGIKDNLKSLNDSNILHAQKVSDEHQTLLNQMQVMTAKYWWLILMLVVLLALGFGIKEAVKLFPFG